LRSALGRTYHIAEIVEQPLGQHALAHQPPKKEADAP
jgi:hypothetical protein